MIHCITVESKHHLNLLSRGELNGRLVLDIVLGCLRIKPTLVNGELS